MPDNQSFTDAVWEGLASVISSAFAMSEARAARLRGNATAKLVAAIPYLAACREPERTALAHLSIYIVAGSEASRKAFDHKAGDDYDLLARLATGAFFEGGDPAIVNKGMKILASAMIRGYRRDQASDLAKGIYNPVASGVWNAEDELSMLKLSIGAVECPEMDGMAEDILAAGDWWQVG